MMDMIFKTAKSKKNTLEDFDFYRQTYFDLLDMSDEQLSKHWRLYGQEEGRFSSLISLLDTLDVDNKMPRTFDPEFYVDLYPDVADACSGNLVAAYEHFLKYGITENRCCSFQDFLIEHKLSGLFDGSQVEPKKVFNLNSEKGVSVNYSSFIDMLKMDRAIKVTLTHDSAVDADFYRDLGKHYELNGNLEKAKNSYLISIMLAESGEVMELIGNYYLRAKDFQGAVNYYNAALELNVKGRWIYENMSQCLFELGLYQESLKILVIGRELFPEIFLFDEIIDSTVMAFWSKRQSTFDSLAAMQKREELIDVTWSDVSLIHNIYQSMYETHSQKIRKSSKNNKKVLIVGDFFIPQCERYRINQKVEHLELAGYKCKTLDWINITSDWSDFAFYDYVIFYRTPAVPEVVKAITYCDCLGKNVIYEIDDMVFDLEYPSDIESFGGYVSLEQYRDLLKGMALFNSAMKLCDVGIASTIPLADKMAPLLKSKKCFVYRNGLDSLNSFEVIDKNHKEYIDIFYGSGTQAHNSDFIDEVLPAIVKVLNNYENTRLVVAGYLKLPNHIIKQYGNRIKMLPFVRSVEAYWEYLKQADINIAVLKNDPINDCKSELKWFEAACYEVPSVLSATKNYKDVVDDGGDAFLASNLDEWYESLAELVASSSRRKSIASAAKKKVIDTYSPEAMAISINEVITNTLTVEV